MRAAIQKAVNALYASGSIPGIFSRWGLAELRLPG